MVYATELLEKEQSGCRALLREDKVVFKFALFCGINSGLPCHYGINIISLCYAGLGGGSF